MCLCVRVCAHMYTHTNLHIHSASHIQHGLVLDEISSTCERFFILFSELAAQRSKFIDSCSPFHFDFSHISHSRPECPLFLRQVTDLQTLKTANWTHNHWENEQFRSVLQNDTCSNKMSNWPMRWGLAKLPKANAALVHWEYGASRVPCSANF